MREAISPNRAQHRNTLPCGHIINLSTAKIYFQNSSKYFGNGNIINTGTRVLDTLFADERSLSIDLCENPFDEVHVIFKGIDAFQCMVVKQIKALQLLAGLQELQADCLLPLCENILPYRFHPPYSTTEIYYTLPRARARAVGSYTGTI